MDASDDLHKSNIFDSAENVENSADMDKDIINLTDGIAELADIGIDANDQLLTDIFDNGEYFDMTDLVDDSGNGLDGVCIDSAINDATGDTPHADTGVALHGQLASPESAAGFQCKGDNSVEGWPSADAARACGPEALCDSQGKQLYHPANQVAADNSGDRILESSSRPTCLKWRPAWLDEFAAKLIRPALGDNNHFLFGRRAIRMPLYCCSIRESTCTCWELYDINVMESQRSVSSLTTAWVSVTGTSSLSPYFAMADFSELLFVMASGGLVMATTVSPPTNAVLGSQREMSTQATAVLTTAGC